MASGDGSGSGKLPWRRGHRVQMSARRASLARSHFTPPEASQGFRPQVLRPRALRASCARFGPFP